MPDSFATSRTVAHQAPLPMGFPRQEYWSGLPFPSPVCRTICTQGWNLHLLHRQAGSSSPNHQGCQVTQVRFLGRELRSPRWSSSAPLSRLHSACARVCMCQGLWNNDQQHTTASASQNKWFWGTATSHRDPYLLFTRMLFLGLAGILS